MILFRDAIFAVLFHLQDVVRESRNADLATMLGENHALSPFAVAITVIALRGRPLPLVGDGAPDAAGVYRFLDAALKACENHSAGCADNMPISWRDLVHKRLTGSPKTAASRILSHDPRLFAGSARLLGRSMCFPGATVDNLGEPYELFVLQSVGLRLECLRLAAAGDAFPLSQLLPRSLGVLRRASLIPDSGIVTRHPVDQSISVALPTGDSARFLARLCTQTAALLLPSMVMALLSPPSTQEVSMKHFEVTQGRGAQAVLPLDVEAVLVACRHVLVASRADCPGTFPAVVMSPQATKRVRDLLSQAMVGGLTDAARAGAEFNANAFVEKARTEHSINIDTFVARAVQAVDAVYSLAVRAARDRIAILFKPTDPVNPMCDVCAIVPCAVDMSIAFLWFEVRDRQKASFVKKLTLANETEFLLAPVAARLDREGISVVGTLYVPVARATFRVVPLAGRAAAPPRHPTAPMHNQAQQQRRPVPAGHSSRVAAAPSTHPGIGAAAARASASPSLAAAPAAPAPTRPPLAVAASRALSQAELDAGWSTPVPQQAASAILPARQPPPPRHRQVR